MTDPSSTEITPEQAAAIALEAALVAKSGRHADTEPVDATGNGGY